MTKFDLNRVARANILELEPYRCARDDYSDGVLLDANENSIGPATGGYDHLSLNRYPDPLHYDLKQHIAKLRGVRKEQIFLGVGSDEAIDILFRIFCNPRDDNALITPPTYGMYKVCAKVNDVPIKKCNLTPEFDVDVEATLATADDKTKLLFLCSPGNPTAKVIPNSVVEEIATRFTTGILVVDEAYIDFSGTESACCLIDKYPNIVVCQTFSKAFGLAGIRLGMAFGAENVIQLMNNVKAPYNVNSLTIEVAKKAYADLSTFETNKAKILSEREYLKSELQKFSAVKKIHTSDANFILFEIPNSQQLYLNMADKGVVCRFRGTETHCNDCLRVTVGTREENMAFMDLLKKESAALS
jgi:histidinol-phosphate aminotransferase